MKSFGLTLLLIATVASAQTPTSTPTAGGFATLTSITIAPQNVTLAEGDTARLTATGHLSNGSVQLDLPVAWTTSDEEVAVVSNVTEVSVQPKGFKQPKVLTRPKEASITDGMVMGMGGGTATIMARFTNLTATTTVTVAALPTPTPTVEPK